MKSIRTENLFRSSAFIGLFVVVVVVVCAPSSLCADGSKQADLLKHQSARAKESTSLNTAKARAGKSPASVYLSRAAANEKFGRTKAEIEDATRAIELEPKNWQAYQLRAKAYFKLGPYKSSIDDYRSAIALAPREVRLCEGLTHVFEKTGENELLIDEVTRDRKRSLEALGVLQATRALLPAKIYEYLGEKKKADADRKEAIRFGQNQWGF